MAIINLAEVIDSLKMRFFKLKKVSLILISKLVSYEFESDLHSLISSGFRALWGGNLFVLFCPNGQ